MKIPHIKQFEDFYRKAWEANTVNKLLRNGLSILEIADALGQDFLDIKKLVVRYNLPTVLETEDERGH